MKRMLKFKKKEITFEDISDFEAATQQEIQEASANCNNWAEVTNRLNSLTTYKNKLTAKAGQIPEDVMKRRHDLEAKAQILRNRLNEIERAQKKAKSDADNNFAAESWTQEYKNLRYSADITVSRMHRLGIADVPLSAVQWKTIKDNNDGVVEIVTLSNRRVKVDLTRLSATHWKLLKEQRFSPLFIGIENSHIVRDGKKENIMLDSSFHTREKIVIQQTWLAVMLV
jgi:hypothetical protein